MSKELESLDVIVFHRFDNLFDNKEYDKNVNIVEEGLERLEAIDNSNPSEAMECLEVINNYGCGFNNNMKFSEVFEKEYNTIKQVLIKSQELEKDKIKSEKDKRFREIVVNKNVDILELKILIEHYSDKVALKRYNSQVGKELQLTEDEFTILKEILK